MNSATVRDLLADLLADPGRALLAALLLLCLVMIIPVIAALRRKAREKERERERQSRRLPLRRSLEPREPRFGPALPYIDDDDDDDDDEEDDEPYHRGGFGAGPPRRGKPLPVGALTKVAWFGLGIAVGAGLMALNAGMLGIGDYFRMPIGPGPDEAAESAPPPVVAQPAPPPKGDTEGRLPQAEEDPVRIAEEALAGLPPEAAPPASAPPPQAAGQAVDVQLAEFVTAMRAQLPMPIGREINLVKVDAAGRAVRLAFAIQRAIPEASYPALQKTLEERFRTGICNGKDELRIRALNQAGISFTVLYADLVGKTVARLAVPPNFCKAPG